MRLQALLPRIAQSLLQTGNGRGRPPMLRGRSVFIQPLVEDLVRRAFFGNGAFVTGKIPGLAHIGERNMGPGDDNALVPYFLQGTRECFQLHPQPRGNQGFGVG